MIGTPELVDVVCLALPRGRANAITITALARGLGQPKREVEEALQAIAAGGTQPLCASTSKPKGVWLGTPDEVRAYVERLGQRIAHQQERRRGLARFLLNQPRPQLWDAARDVA